MRLAILSDIHANADALAATLEEARGHGAERLLLLGDYVGYHFHPERAIDLLLTWPHDAIRGNHDRMLLEAADDDEYAKIHISRYGPALERALRELGGDRLAWLRSLPDTLELRYLGKKILLCHGSPDDPDRYVYWNSPPEVLAKCLDVDADIVLLGHTHHPFVSHGTPMLLNPGSVGQPRDLGGFASWCLFDLDRSTVSFRRTAYDVAAVAQDLVRYAPGRNRELEVLWRRNPVLEGVVGAGIKNDL